MIDRIGWKFCKCLSKPSQFFNGCSQWLVGYRVCYCFFYHIWLPSPRHFLAAVHQASSFLAWRHLDLRLVKLAEDTKPICNWWESNIHRDCPQGFLEMDIWYIFIYTALWLNQDTWNMFGQGVCCWSSPMRTFPRCLLVHHGLRHHTRQGPRSFTRALSETQ